MQIVIGERYSAVRRSVIAISVLIIVGIAEVTGISAPVRTLGERLSGPFLKVGTAAVFHLTRPFTWVWSTREAALRIQDLQLRHAEAIAQVTQLRGLQEENEELRALVQVKDRPASTLVVRPIISYAQPTLEGGRSQGIRQGSMVLAAQTLLGIVQEVNDTYGVVGLLSDASTAPVLARTTSGTEGLVKGDGRRVLLTEVPADAKLEIGEQVVTLGQPGIESNIFIGNVRALEGHPASATKTAVLEQLVSFYDVRLVEVR